MSYNTDDFDRFFDRHFESIMNRFLRKYPEAYEDFLAGIDTDKRDHMLRHSTPDEIVLTQCHNWLVDNVEWNMKLEGFKEDEFCSYLQTKADYEYDRQREEGIK
jgi:hypothetical protein